jgi:hypothetical protein
MEQSERTDLGSQRSDIQPHSTCLMWLLPDVVFDRLRAWIPAGYVTFGKYTFVWNFLEILFKANIFHLARWLHYYINYLKQKNKISNSGSFMV